MAHDPHPWRDDELHIPPDLVIGPTADVLPAAVNPNWGIETFGVDSLRLVTLGEGVIAGIVDTGALETHPDLRDNFLAQRNFTSSPPGPQNPHGTHVTGTVCSSNPRLGMAPAAKFVHGKGLGDSGSGSGTAIANAMKWCVDQGATILNLSLGSSGPISIVDQVGSVLASHGIWIFCAAGNSGGNTGNVDYPARYPWAMSVAALAPNLQPASFTNRGAKIDTSYAGVNIWSTSRNGSYQSMSGTSMATPGIAGVLCLYRAALIKKGLPIPTTMELRELLKSRSTDAGEPGIDVRTGPGWLTPILLTLGLTPEPPPVGGHQ